MIPYMDNHYTLRIKLGTDEFEATGPVEVVEAQFKIFSDLVANRQSKGASGPHETGDKDAYPETMASLRTDVDSAPDAVDASRDTIMRVDARVVSLKARPRSSADAALLILYGQKLLRKNESVTGGEVIRGLAPSGSSIA